MTCKKKLIEVALPLEDINREATRENFIYKGNPSAIHKWWAQRPLAACRAVLFSSLVDDPSECVAELLAEIGSQIRPERELLDLKIPHEEAALIARLHKVGQVLERRYLTKTARFKARIPPHHHAEFAAFIIG